METFEVERSAVCAISSQSSLFERLVEGLWGRHHGILVAWRVLSDDELGSGRERVDRLSKNFSATELTGMG